MLISRERFLSELVKEGNDANVLYANRREFRAGVAEGLRLANVIARSEVVTPKSKESPSDSPLAPCNTGSPKISPELNMVLDMAQDGRIIAVSFDIEAAKALKALHDYRAKIRAGA